MGVPKISNGRDRGKITQLFIVEGLKVVGVASGCSYETKAGIDLYIVEKGGTAAVLCYSEKDRPVPFNTKAVNICMRKIIRNNWESMLEKFSAFIDRVNTGDKVAKVFSGFDCKVDTALEDYKETTELSFDIRLNPDFSKKLLRKSTGSEVLEVTGTFDGQRESIRLASKFTR